MHLYNYPMGFLPLDFYGKIKYAQFLHDGSEILFTEGSAETYGDSPIPARTDLLILHLPAIKPNCLVPVVELFLK